MRNRPAGNSVQTGGGVVIDHKLDFSGLLDISRDMELLSKAENKKVLRDGTGRGRSAERGSH
jgi:hypothetical protein